MAKYTATRNNWTPTAVADAAAFTDSGYFALQGGSATQSIAFLELYMGGLASASAPAQMILARDSSNGATALSGGTIAAMNPNTTAPTLPTQFSTSTTKPQRSATLYLLLPVFNAFGGVVRLNQPPGQEIMMFGCVSQTSSGEVSLSHASTGTAGLMGCHFIFDIL